MPSPSDADVGELIKQLSGAGVEFIVVGGAAAVLHGAPITTEDLDIVHRASPENVSRLRTLLEELDAYVRELASRHEIRAQQSRDLRAHCLKLESQLTSD